MRRNRLFRLAGGIVLVILAVAVLIWALDIRRPLPCILYITTGLYCPTCGATRAIIHLMHGNISDALRCNMFVTIIALPTAIFYVRFVIGLILDKPRLYNLSTKGIYIIVIIAATMLMFGILRNIPTTPFVWMNPIN